MESLVNNNIGKLRTDAGITQAELADIIGCNVATINRYEGGHRDPSIETALRLAAYFGKSIDEMFSLKDKVK